MAKHHWKHAQQSNGLPALVDSQQQARSCAAALVRHPTHRQEQWCTQFHRLTGQQRPGTLCRWAGRRRVGKPCPHHCKSASTCSCLLRLTCHFLRVAAQECEQPSLQPALESAGSAVAHLCHIAKRSRCNRPAHFSGVLGTHVWGAIEVVTSAVLQAGVVTGILAGGVLASWATVDLASSSLHGNPCASQGWHMPHSRLHAALVPHSPLVHRMGSWQCRLHGRVSL